MAVICVFLPDALSGFVEKQVAQGGYRSPSEYIVHLVRQDQRRIAQEELDSLLLEGLESGEAIPVTDEYWECKRAALRKRIARNP